MAKLYDIKELMAETGLSERTLRYYLAEVVHAPSGTPGRKAYYPREVLDQLQVARRVLQGDYDPKRGEVKPTLRAFREWLATLSPEDVREMAEMPYRIRPKQLVSWDAAAARSGAPAGTAESARAAKAPASEAAADEAPAPMSRRPAAGKKRREYDDAPAMMHKMDSRKLSAPMRKEDKAAENESAADYLDRVAGQKTPPKPEPGPWRRYRFGDELEIKTRRRLTDAQERQLKLAGKLLRNMLEEG
jgi:hypothetical protein